MTKLKNTHLKKKVFVTGGTGFIGSSIVANLKEKNYKIIVLTRKKKLKDKSFSNVNFVIGSLQNFRSNYLKNCDYLLHFANHDTTNFNRDFVNAYQSDVVDSINLIKLAIKNGIKNFLIAGSCFEYGNLKKKNIDIDSNLLPMGYYAITKAALFLQIKNLIKKEKNIKVTYLRYFQVYGKNENKNRLFPQLIKNAKKNKNFKINNGQLVRDFIEVNEAVDKSLDFFFKNKKKLLIKNIGTGQGLKLSSFARKIWRSCKPKSKLRVLNKKSYQPFSLIAKI